MTRQSRLGRLARTVLWFVPGACVLGTSCASDVKDTLLAAGLDFVGDSAGTVLNTLIPVEAALSGGGS